ncbi:M48 family metallopeptidase [Aquicoccus porphyridii]|uniref:M48 family metallopeptidase n=1 Tax=Aquicoccus porphyridii TaxID=1852029 RepID=UPI00273DAB08|nr:SprT family zinc-dependent metalloprotease [Aquicoccus porphyridii]
MRVHVIPGDPPVELVLRRSGRARRISLRVSSLDGRVTLTCPQGVPEGAALDFARDKADWLRQQLARTHDAVPVGIGCDLPFRGRLIRVLHAPGRGVLAERDCVHVGGAPDHAAARLQGFFKQTARDRLAAASDRYAAALGRPYARLTLRDTRSRWGSCSSRGGLMYSWRLIMAPDDVLDYVAAHEVAHLAEMNHSPRFWHHVTQLYGDCSAPRRWLREHGPGLHRYQF